MAGITTVILGGGRGARLFPLTKDRAKPGVPIAGKFRLIDIPMSNCIHSGLERTFILTQYNSASLNHHVANTYQFGLSRSSVRVLAAEQTNDSEDWFLGTADALRRTLAHIVTPRERPDHILVLSGDHLYRMNYGAMIQQHLDQQADITVAVTPVSRQEAPRFGILQLAEDGLLSRFVEKPEDAAALEGFATSASADGEFLGSMGIYLFKTSVLVDEVQKPSNIDFGRDIFPAAVGNRKICGHVFDGYWADIGTIGSFFDANLALLDRVPRFDFYNEEAPVFSARTHLPGAKINESSLRETMIGEGSVLDESVVTRTIVGPRSFIRRNTHLDNCMLMGADYYESAEQIADNQAMGIPPMGIGQGCRLHRTIIDKNAHVGDDVHLVNEAGVTEADGQGWYIRENIIIVPKGGVIPSGTRV